jgi:hypothetical protein
MVERVSVNELSGFAVNWGGGEGRMPLSFTLGQGGEHDHEVSIVAVRVLEIAHLLARDSHGTALVFRFDNDTWSTEHGGTIDPLEIAVRLGIDAAGYRTHWASLASGPELEHGAIAVPAVSLAAFLGEFEHYNLQMIDVPSPPNPAEMDEFILEWNTTEHPERRVFQRGHFWLRSHDDCFLTVRSRHAGLATDIVRTAIALYAAARVAIRVPACTATAAIPPDSLLNELLQKTGTWTACEAGDSRIADEVLIDFVPAMWRAGTPVPAGATHRLCYQVSSGTWALDALE